jgi:2-amino-4-hydroxy-6-hydroxymethyldihydropteridine diphosphokinase
MKDVYLLIGGNMGDREAYLRAAVRAIEKTCGAIRSESSVYETEAWGLPDQDAFLNQVIEIETSLDPEELLKQILQIEETLGRKRLVKNGPRLIDIDILFYADRVIEQEGLKVPHPRIQDRRFVLEPLNQIAPKMVHPVFHKSISQLLKECADPLKVNKFN